jgi:hypothetical protein
MANGQEETVSGEAFLLKGSPLSNFGGGDDAGISSSGSSTRLVDKTKYWANGIWQGALLEMSLGGQLYTTIVTNNTQNTIIFPAVPFNTQFVGVHYLLKRLTPSLTRFGFSLTGTQVLKTFAWVGSLLSAIPSPFPWFTAGIPKGGTYTAVAPSATVMTDAIASFPPGLLMGMEIFNITDVSRGTIIANTVNTITVAALSGGTLNTWSLGDSYVLGAHLIDVDTGIPMPYTVSAGYTISAVADSRGFNQDGDALIYFDGYLAVDAGYFVSGAAFDSGDFPGFSTSIADPTGAAAHIVDVITVNYGLNTMYGSIQYATILEQVS